MQSCQGCLKPLAEVLRPLKFLRRYPFHEKNNSKCKIGCKCKSIPLYWCAKCVSIAPKEAITLPVMDSDVDSDSDSDSDS